MTPSDLLARVCKARGVSLSRIRGNLRSSRISHVRHEIWWVLRETFEELSLPEIGNLTGGHHHTSALHGWRRIELACQKRPEYRRELLALAGPTFAQALAAAANEERTAA